MNQTNPRTYVTIRENIRLYSDGCCREFLGEGATTGNGSDVAPGERVLRRSLLDPTSLTPADRAVYDAWCAEQDEYRRQAGY